MCPEGPGTECRVELCVRQVNFREETSSSKNQCAMVITVAVSLGSVAR